LEWITNRLEQFKPKPDLTPDGQVLLQTSMAETERRKQRDVMDMQLKGKQIDIYTQLALKKQADDMARSMEELQLKLAIAVGDNETKEKIESARLTRDAAKLRQEQTYSAPPTFIGE
jgi:hypothetical protein